jgi:hypothetical protein
MSTAEEMANQAADRVREVIADAEQRAAEIVKAAESEAAGIRERAEADARERIERARAALSDPAGGDGEAPPAAAHAAEPLPGVGAAATEPLPTVADAGPPEAEVVGAPTSHDHPGVRAGNGGGDDAAVRLMAMQMALEGKSREQISTELESKFGSADRSALLDDVLARAGN